MNPPDWEFLIYAVTECNKIHLLEYCGKVQAPHNRTGVFPFSATSVLFTPLHLLNMFKLVYFIGNQIK